MKNINDIRIRDPFILLFDNRYYMYGTTNLGSGIDAHPKFSVYVSDDLVNFEGPFVVFDGEKQNFWADKDYWAAEVWQYKGKFYLFGSFRSDTHKRATQILVSQSPMGPFVPLSEKPTTPENWDCLDGTLWVENGQPYMVFCHEWTQCGNGEICAVRLSDDLSTCLEEPFLLFKAGDNPDVSEIGHGSGVRGKVTDGPFLFEENGSIKMIWSSFSNGKYSVFEATAANIKGEWTHRSSRFDFDGGHAMIFTDKQGKKFFSLHHPNTVSKERATFIPYIEE